MKVECCKHEGARNEDATEPICEKESWIGSSYQGGLSTNANLSSEFEEFVNLVS